MQTTPTHSHSVWFGDELKQQHSVGTYINCSSWLRMRSILLCKIEVLVSDDDSEMNDFSLILMTQIVHVQKFVIFIPEISDHVFHN